MNLSDTIEIDCELNEEHNKLIEDILSFNFPLYYSQSLPNYPHSVFGHQVIARHHTSEPIQGETNSDYSERIMSMFKHICDKNNIKVDVVYRAAINVTTYHDGKIAGMHIDHDFPHKIFIMYLNEFSDGYTYVMYDNKIESYKPEKNKAIIFEGSRFHAQGFCKPHERRVVFVVGFS